MKFTFLYGFFSVVLLCSASAQEQADEVLFTIEGDTVYTSEFVRVFNKNLELVQEEEQKNVEAYLKLFINYKLKLREARALGLDKKPNYLREFNSYKKQLTKNYLSDKKVTDALVEEAYERLAYEVNASHVLIKIDEFASPEDSLAAYNEVLKLRTRVLEEGFKAVQKEVHDGKIVFAEDLDYFTALKMIYSFENVAYNTPVGETSMPFRTRFGFHFMQVYDKRKARGKVTVSHILIKEDEDKIRDIHKRLEQGEEFAALAKQFSEDKGSAIQGGLMSPFSTGGLPSKKFEDAAFALVEKGQLSQPIKTKFGWHIIKLHEKHKMEDYESMKPKLTSRISRDSRSEVINASRLNNLKERYKLSDEQPALTEFKKFMNTSFYQGKWRLPDSVDLNTPFLKIKEKQLTYQDFAEYLQKRQRRITRDKSLAAVVNETYAAFFETEVLKYQEDNLGLENEDFAQILGEYRDGLLLFDLMENKIWNTAQTDSLAMKKYYAAYKTKYVMPEHIEATVASAANKRNIKMVQKLLKAQVPEDSIKAQLNINDQVKVSFTNGKMNAKHQALPKPFKFKKGLSKIHKHNGAYVVVNIRAIHKARLKSYEEAKGQVINDYQAFKEENWLKELSFKYIVRVNKEVLKELKENLN